MIRAFSAARSSHRYKREKEGREEAVEMFGSDLGYPNTYAEDEIPSDEEVEEMIEAQIEEGSAWAIKSAKAR